MGGDYYSGHGGYYSGYACYYSGRGGHNSDQFKPIVLTGNEKVLRFRAVVCKLSNTASDGAWKHSGIEIQVTNNTK